MRYSRSTIHGSSGFTMIELITVISIATLLIGTAVMNLKAFDNPLQNGAAQLQGFFKQVRAQAISTTSAYIVQPSSATHLIAKVGTNCSDSAPVTNPNVALDLPNGAHFTDTTWNLCFSSRGFPDGNIEVEIRDLGGQYKIIEVMLGGGVRIQ